MDFTYDCTTSLVSEIGDYTQIPHEGLPRGPTSVPKISGPPGVVSLGIGCDLPVRIAPFHPDDVDARLPYKGAL